MGGQLAGFSPFGDEAGMDPRIMQAMMAQGGLGFSDRDEEASRERSRIMSHIFNPNF